MDANGNTGRERRLLARANAQLGLLHHHDLQHEGLGRGAIANRLANARLTRVFGPVYAFGHTALAFEALWLAALWACGPGVALSHVTAAAYFGWRTPDPGEPVHLSTTRAIRSREGITVHRVRYLAAIDLFQPRRFTVTAIPRTFVDLADVLPWPDYRALADGQRRLSVEAIAAAQRRAPFRAGAQLVRRLIEADEAHTKSEFERRYLRFAARHGLPRPDALNTPLAGHTVDCLYASERLVVELDGRAYHQRRAEMRADRRRDSDVQLAGHRILRLVWDDLHADEAAQTADRVARMLAIGAD